MISKYILKDRLRKLKVLCDQNKDKRPASEMDENELQQWRDTLKDCQLLHKLLVNGGPGVHRGRENKSTAQESSGKSKKGSNQLYFFDKQC